MKLKSATKCSLAAVRCSFFHYFIACTLAACRNRVHNEFSYFSGNNSTFFFFLHKIKKLWKSSAHLCACVIVYVCVCVTVLCVVFAV